MAIYSALAGMFGVRYPIVLAPMANVSGGELASAVSNAGGLGLVGGGYGDPAWLHRELRACKEKSQGPWGGSGSLRGPRRQKPSS